MASSKRKSRKPGLPPGDLGIQSSKTPDKIEMSLMVFDQNTMQETIMENIEECFSTKGVKSTTWINIDDTEQIDTIRKIGKNFDFHPLLLEDIVEADQRPKIDDYGDHLFIVLKMLSYDVQKQEIQAEQLSIVLGKNYVISFQENDKKGDVFGPIRDRIRANQGKLRKSGADYLLYRLVDIIVDNYFLILEVIGGRIEEMENKLISNPNPENLKELYQLKREMIYLRKAVWPLREVINRLDRDESPLICEETRIYIRDVYDHTIQVIDTIESYRDLLGGLMDIYLSSLSHKMNSVMKVLTVISTIFMPLTFIVGIYGMNFENMPELKWENGYYLVLCLCALAGISMLFFFKRKRWL